MATDNVSIDDLIARSGALKRELVTFTRSARFAKQLDRLLYDAAGHNGHLDQNQAIPLIDHFALQHVLPNGRTVVERFVAQRQPRLSQVEREMMLGWRDVVEGLFEVRGFDGDAVEFHNLLDDLVYRVHSNMGRETFAALSKGLFVIGRIVPVHPATDAWLVSGTFTTHAETAGRTMAQIAVEEITTRPGLMLSNPAMVARGWELQASHRAEFIAQVGSDLVILPPHGARETLREHYRRLQDKAMTAFEGEVAPTGPGPDELGILSDDLMDADSVVLIYDEVEGLSVYRDFGRLDALFADPSLARDRDRLAQLQGYLDDDSVSPLAIRRLVERHPDGADPVFHALLRKPSFSWSRDGEKLLRREKKSFFDREPRPRISVIGERLTELLRLTE